MNAINLLQALEARGVFLTRDGRKLIVDAPTGALTAADRDLLCRLKPALLSILEANPTPDELPPDWQELWTERAAIMEFDGGLCRERAKELALADVLRAMKRAGILFLHHA